MISSSGRSQADPGAAAAAAAAAYGFEAQVAAS